MSYKNVVNILLLICLFYNAANKIKKLKKTKQNILFILVDDLRYLTNETVYLPNLHKMAIEGVTFENAFAQQALCTPSRISIFTGRRPDSLQLYHSYNYWRKATKKFQTLPEFLKQNGYNTFGVGNLFDSNETLSDKIDYHHSWTKSTFHASSNKDTDVCEGAKSKKLKKNLICPVVVSKQPNGTLPDLEILNEGIRILKLNENSKKPFFLAIGFDKPHIPLKFPIKYLEKVPLSKVRLPVSSVKPTKMPLVAWHPWMDVRNRQDIERLHILFPMGVMPDKWTLKIRQSYYAATLFIDDLIGTLITHANRSDTIIVITSDHGFSLGENGLWSKYSNFDAALRVPLIFNIPGIESKSIKTPVELIDLFPTLTALIGLNKNIPKCKYRDKSKLCFDGKSLVPIMLNKYRGPPYTGQPFAFSQYPRPSVKPWGNTCNPSPKDIKIMGYTVRTDRYRYTEWVSFNNTSFQRNWSNILGNELYDYVEDSNESNNVYSDEDYKILSKRLSNLLRTHVERGIYSFNDFEYLRKSSLLFIKNT